MLVHCIKLRATGTPSSVLCNGFAFLEKFLSCHGRSVVTVIRPENHTMSAPPSEAPRSPVAGEKRCASVEEGPGAFVRER